jgi:Holliday junction resolvase RusA-like endonuclease
VISLKLPITPIPAARPRFGKGFTYTPKKYRDFKELAKLYLLDRYPGKPLEGALEVCVVFSIEKPRSVKREYPHVKPDIDNFIKAIFDSANEILWHDDSQIVDLHTFKIYGIPSITISVKQKGGEQ